MNRQLVFVEGVSGSGKTTTATWLAGELRARGRPGPAYPEMDDPHPLHSNIVFHRGSPHPIDFDDCDFGYFLYDIATLLGRIEMREGYATLRAALLDGYRQVRPLSAEHEAHLDLFVLARWVCLGTVFLSRPEFGHYAPRFMGIVVSKIERHLRAAESA